MNGQHPIRRDISDICPVKWKTSFRCYPPGVARMYGGKLLKLARVYIHIYLSFSVIRIHYTGSVLCCYIVYQGSRYLSSYPPFITLPLSNIYTSFVSVWRFDIFLIRLIYICFLFVNSLNNCCDCDFEELYSCACLFGFHGCLLEECLCVLNHTFHI